MKTAYLKYGALALLAGMVSGCSTYTEQVVSQSFQPAEAPVVVSQAPKVNGAIFQQGRSGLFATDQRARRIGDILTVSFNETYAATKAQTASSSKTDAFGVTLPTALPNMLTGGFDKDPAGLNAGTTRSFAGLAMRYNQTVLAACCRSPWCACLTMEIWKSRARKS